MKRSELQRKTPLKRASSPRRRRGVSEATPGQRARVADRACIVGSVYCAGPIDPTHLIDRSLAPTAGNDPRAVVPCCRFHHVLYDEHKLDLSPYLEPRYREEIAHAVEAVGLFGALRRITGLVWVPESEHEEAAA